MNVVVGVIVDIKDEHGEVMAEQNVEDDGEGDNTKAETEDDHDKVLEVELHIEREDGNRDSERGEVVEGSRTGTWYDGDEANTVDIEDDEGVAVRRAEVSNDSLEESG